MTRPSVQTLYQVVEATWPAEETIRVGPWTIRRGMGGGSRVSATTAAAPITPTDVLQAESAMSDLGQDHIFMIRQGDDDLDAVLDTRGYRIKDPVNLYSADIAILRVQTAPDHMTLRSWPPLAIQASLWQEGHIGPERIAVMARATGPKTTILVRHKHSPAGTVFLGVHDRIAMFHALEVSPQHRRHGLARTMIREAARWADEHGATQMSLVVTQANSGANRLYTSMGFALVGQYHYRIAKK